MSSIKLTNGALDIFKRGGEETLIIRGVLDFTCLTQIRVDEYQRENVSSAKINALALAIQNSNVPDVELGMRGEKHQEREDGHTFILQDDVYVIDGLQRITAAKHLIQTKPDSQPRIGALVHLNTNFDWERERFRILNQERTRLSPNVLLRNLRTENEAIAMLYNLCDDPTFALHNRVSWAQNMLRTHIIAALGMCKTIGMLHSRFGPGRSDSSIVLPTGLMKIMEKVGRNTMRENIKRFFDLIDECFGIRQIVFAHGAVQIKGTFLLVMADVLTRHDDFWNGNRLEISRDLKKKIAQFPIRDPEVARLGTSGGKARDILLQLMVEHINSGKRTRRLTLSPGYQSETTEEEQAAVAS